MKLKLFLLFFILSFSALSQENKSVKKGFSQKKIYQNFKSQFKTLKKGDYDFKKLLKITTPKNAFEPKEISVMVLLSDLEHDKYLYYPFGKEKIGEIILYILLKVDRRNQEVINLVILEELFYQGQYLNSFVDISKNMMVRVTEIISLSEEVIYKYDANGNMDSKLFLIPVSPSKMDFFIGKLIIKSKNEDLKISKEAFEIKETKSLLKNQLDELEVTNTDLTSFEPDVYKWFMRAEVYYMQKNYSKAYPFYRKAAVKGYPTAQAALGRMYSEGWGVKKDKSTSFYWFKKAAMQGDKIAQHNLGTIYRYGDGIEENYPKAFFWYKKAADQGFVNAQFSVGMLYLDGIGVAKNNSQAEYYLKKAADQEHEKAIEILKKMGVNDY